MAWALVGSWTWSTNVAQVDFADLVSYSDIRILVRSVTLSGAGTRSLRVSINNGSTFLSTASDYFSVGTDGNEAGATSIGFHTTASASARTAEIEICGFNLTDPKVAQRRTRTDSRTTVIPTGSQLTAIRIFDATSGFNLTGGNIYVFGR